MAPRFRFAPSPTGTLHVGGARTAILNWLLSRRYGGAFVLRIEDTDAERNVAGAEAAVLDDLRWLGLDWDEGPDRKGSFGPYRQSDRGTFYEAAASRLLVAGHAYNCSCPAQAELSGERRRRCGCAHRDPDTDPLPGMSVRFRASTHGEITVRDAVRGDVVFPADSVEDFVLLRSNGRPTYNFAAAVDDSAMQITHVVRGADHLNNTPKQVAVYEALGLPVPLFAHIPLILGPDRQKLSKRHGATSVGEHRRLGYLPEALVNYLSLLSWSSPSGDEFLPRARLLEEVALERVGASDAVFDDEKLRWLSHRHLQELPLGELEARIGEYTDFEALGIDEDHRPRAVESVRERLFILSEAGTELAHFTGPTTVEQHAARDSLANDAAALDVLATAADHVERLETWTAEGIGQAFRSAGKELGVRGRALFHPLRVALTGEEHGPDLSRVAYVLGRERVLVLLHLDQTKV